VAEKVALEYADTITLSDRDVDDGLFARLRQFYDDDTIVGGAVWETFNDRLGSASREPQRSIPSRD